MTRFRRVWRTDALESLGPQSRAMPRGRGRWGRNCHQAPLGLTMLPSASSMLPSAFLTASAVRCYKITMKRACRRLLLIVIVSFALFAGVSWVYAQRLTRARPSVVGEPPSELPSPVECVTFVSRDEQTLS